MIDLFSLKDKRKDLVIAYFIKKKYRMVGKGRWITVMIYRWYKTITISCLISNDLVTLIIFRTKVFPFYEKYTVL